MRIAELTSYIVRIPLRKEFKHASHTRRSSDNVLICCRLKDGTEGWGEGVPRSYVTGETAETAMQQLAATPLAEQLDRDCTCWEDVLELCLGIQPMVLGEDPRQCRSNSLRCAIEISILDAYARLFGEPVSSVTGRLQAAETVRGTNDVIRYSGGITATEWRKEVSSAVKMRAFGFAHCKVKVGIPSVDDDERLRRIRWWLGSRMDVRLDANEAWHGSEVVAKLEPLTQHDISCVEQPVPHEEVDSIAELRRQVPVPVMLDESLTSIVDGQTAIERGTCDLFNLRLSKCGGFLNCLELAALAHAEGLGYQLGCHPGESGVLSAAGRHFAASVRNLRYHEGSYDRFLLKKNLTNENITIGYGGRAPALTGPGLGVTINRDHVKRLALQAQTYRLE